MGKFRIIWGLETLNNCVFTCFWFVVMRLVCFIINQAGLAVELSLCSLCSTLFSQLVGCILSPVRHDTKKWLSRFQNWEGVFSSLQDMFVYQLVSHTLVSGFCYLNQREGRTDLYLSHLVYKYLGLCVFLLCQIIFFKDNRAVNLLEGKIWLFRNYFLYWMLGNFQGKRTY